MSSPSSFPEAISPPLSGPSCIAPIQPILNLLLIGTACSASLAPIIVALFFFSTSKTRKQWYFALNLLVLILGLIEGAVTIYIQSRLMLAMPVPTQFIALYACLVILIPTFADSILLLRVIAVYRPRQMSACCRGVVYGPIVLAKAARITIDLLFIVTWMRAVTEHSYNPLQAGQEAWVTPYPKLAWILELFDSTWASILFLYRLGAGALDGSLVRGHSVVRANSSTGFSFQDRLRTLFWICVSNFVFPVVLNLAQLILAFRETNFLDGAYILTVNNYVQIIGVLLATIWQSGSKHPALASSGERDANGHILSEPHFASASMLEDQSIGLSSRTMYRVADVLQDTSRDEASQV